MATLIANLRNRHEGKTVAILGSGPSLQNYAGDAEVAIAVNGAAAIEHPYTYFLCGDKRSPDRSWFLQSRNCGATRIVSSFVAPRDSLLYPDQGVRTKLQEDFLRHKRRYKRFGKPFVFAFRPKVPPEPPHCYFRYGGGTTSSTLFLLRFWLASDSPRFLAGGTISGVALQLAVYMGARAVDFFGVDMSNFDGRTYFSPADNVGLTKSHHPANFTRLKMHFQKKGIQIRHHHGVK